MINLIKDKQYRIIQTDGKKWRGTFVGKFDLLGSEMYEFSFESHLIDGRLIAKIDEFEVISPDTQAIEQDCFREYLKYSTIKGKKTKRKFIYTEIYNKSKNK